MFNIQTISFEELLISSISSEQLERSGVFQLTPNDNPYTEYRTSKTYDGIMLNSYKSQYSDIDSIYKNLLFPSFFKIIQSIVYIYFS